jgi:phosphoribosylanthranilate isomerase
MTIVKICGITTLEDALTAADAGAELLGLNFYKKSPRYIHPDEAMKLAASLRLERGAKSPLLVGVFVNEIVGRMSITMEQVGLNFVQLSGDESVEMLRELRGIGFKALRPRHLQEALDDAAYYGDVPCDPRIPTLLLDAHNPSLYGGTGERASTEIALGVKAKTARLMLAGGLNPGNVGDVVRTIRPWGVDVASGVEGDTPGRKDAGKVRAFIDVAKAEGV